MALTKNGRIRKLIYKIKGKKARKVDGKTPECYIKINYYALGETEKERRKTEVERLETALGTKIVRPQQVPFYDSPAKKPRMRKFSHRRNTPKPEKQGGKKGGKK